MEMLSWMKNVDMTMEKEALLDMIDNMYGIINSLIAETRAKDVLIQELKEELEKIEL
ncbi:hypothetical protein [Alkaliphilus oremlandii]|uniref:Uncharacterized protein n=1 Tax=Alkaliphilus oremlandii (strain OhILAs) TaxID=350688 RepID=A8MJL6_ALKOO|nr:hypothetical protein [Alkaliphilus oremlandii]ABW19998.1 hypothetical protein Clos_2466 [Alkaliphilus oremlandii OhILAs]